LGEIALPKNQTNMKATKLTCLLVIAVALTLASTGCRKSRQNVTEIPGSKTGIRDPGPTGIPPTGRTANPDPGAVGQQAPGGGPQSDKWGNPDNFNEDRAALAAHTVHFDLDLSVVKSSEKSNVEAAAAYLKANPKEGLRIEGNCDERGTEEYNRALGERRALAVREIIVADGVEADRVVTVSFGKDKPVALGHDEAAWAINRRADFVVLHPK
jgi:peptidoglycan-associated lipoprotein